MFAGYVGNAPHTRALRYAHDADNDTLVRWTCAATRHAWPLIEWPDSIARTDAAETVHAFAREAVRYEREDGDQLIRMPWRTIADGVGDCKSLAVLVASLCAAAGCRVVLRFAQFPGEDWYGHVYAVVDGVAVDPELEFGKEVLSSAHLDRRIR